MHKIGKHLIISGRVQGVGFRHFTYRNARELKINGWVKNLRDGTVEAVLAGTPQNVANMIERLQQGPRSARVENIRESDEPVNPDNFNDFSIRR